ncbi:acetoacetate-CoA ligase [Laetiporus sulphureus 93-53]|uniref:Acetoacetate-CoA ligase n=1 Tax=Laetiporus sulphureus 93-53 TaxID=1314785 RepID=A0A165GTN7_9APHY|nr:acetoacetate-CoA ligase [Laetiporus sulphureus 93-53]KZT10799.1 acetoacetate-CoA ligase [Laetiporus sulphureus 93-53]
MAGHTESHFAQSKLIWRPAHPSRTSLDVFRRVINRKHGLNLRNYHELHKYSVEDYTFWTDVWEFVGIIYSVPPTQVLQDGPIKELPTWFPGARLNYAENLLHRNDDGIACTAARETGAIFSYTYRQLRQMVRSMAAAMRVSGIVAGDRVAAIVTNSIDAVVIALASASIGAIFSSTATDMGTQGILDRYRQIQPKIVFSETEVTWAGKPIDLMPKVLEIAQALQSHGLQRVVLLPSARTGQEVTASHMNRVPGSTSLSAFLSAGGNLELVFEQLPFNHPLYILYSSGTSGPPKCIVHTAGGVLMQAKKDLRISLGLTVDDTYFQYTTTGWMMWPYMLQGLACGSRIILYDGSPFYPNVTDFLKFLSRQGVTVFGTSPRFLSEVQGKGIEPSTIAPFDALRTVGSTGSVLAPAMFEWAQKAFNPDVHLVSFSGGTDICGAFVGGVPTLPVYAGEIQGKLLGMKVEIFDQDGKNMEDTGLPGELVCTRPHVSLPLGLWGDKSGAKVRKAYFEKYPSIWHQGDFIAKNPETQGLMILGRSDGVLNPSGVRFGSAEIYTVLEDFADVIDDSLCVGQRRPQDKDERVLLFVKMRAGHVLTESLKNKLRAAIRKSLSHRHVPAYIFEIEDIPYTVNGKKIEIAVKQIVSGSTLKPSGTVANPDSLQLYYKYRELEKFIGGTSAEKAKAKL